MTAVEELLPYGGVALLLAVLLWALNSFAGGAATVRLRDQAVRNPFRTMMRHDRAAEPSVYRPRSAGESLVMLRRSFRRRPPSPGAPRPRQRVRQVLNVVNLSTPLGLLVAFLGRARTVSGPEGLILAYGYRSPFPVAAAFTIGNVIISRHDEGYLSGRLLYHESRHATQFAVLLGLPTLPLYALATTVSVLISGDPYSSCWPRWNRSASKTRRSGHGFAYRDLS